MDTGVGAGQRVYQTDSMGKACVELLVLANDGKTGRLMLAHRNRLSGVDAGVAAWRLKAALASVVRSRLF